MNCSVRRPRFIDHLFLTFDFRQIPRRIFLQFFPFLVPRWLRCQNFHSLRHRNKFVNYDVVLWWIFSPFPAKWSSWLGGSEFPIRILVDSMASRMHASFVLFLTDPPLPQCFIILQGIAGATDVSNFLRAKIDGFLEFLILGVDERDST